MNAEFETKVLRNISSLHTKELVGSKYEDDFQKELYKTKSEEALSLAKELLMVYGSQVTGRRYAFDGHSYDHKINSDKKIEQKVAYLVLEIPNIVVEEQDGSKWNGTIWISPIHAPGLFNYDLPKPNEFHNGVKILAKRNGTQEPKMQTPLYYLTNEGVKIHPKEKASLSEIEDAKNLIIVLGSIMESRGFENRSRKQLFPDIVYEAASFAESTRYVGNPL